MRRGFCLLTFLAFTGFAFGVEQRFADIGDFPVAGGEVIKDCRIGYRIYGSLERDDRQIIVVPTWFTGTTGGMEQYGIIGSGRLVDTDRYTVISFDALGNGVSCSPSSTEEFPRISTADMVRSQHLVMTEHLGIDNVFAVIGISMGGMQAFRWIELYPEFMDRVVPIDGTPRQTSFDLHNWGTQKYIARTMQDAGLAEAEIQKMLSRVGLLTLYTPAYFVKNVSGEQLPDFQVRSDSSYTLGVDDYVAQLEAMIEHDVLGDGVPGNLAGRMLIVGVPSDQMVNQSPAREYATAAGVEYFTVESDCGHIGTTCEMDSVAAKVHAFLDQ